MEEIARAAAEGTATDEQLIPIIEKTIALRKQANPDYDGSAVWARLRVAKHIRDGTPQPVAIGKLVPDGPYHPSGGGAAGMLHAAIKRAGPRPLTLLNFGSWT